MNTYTHHVQTVTLTGVGRRVRKFRFLIGLVKLASKRYAWRITVETWTRRSE